LDENNFYTLQEEPISDLEVLGDSVVLHGISGNERLIFFNAFVNKESTGGSGGGTGGSGKDSKGGKSSSFFTSDLMTYMLFPASIGAVYYW
jgi:hypothetical protein